MNKQIAGLSAAVLLLVSSASLFAGELPFNAPSTQFAQRNAALLHRVAHALHDRAPDGSRISDLWLFPTNDTNTVFAEYTLKANGQRASSTERLAELTLRGNEVLRMRDLTGSAVDSRSDGPPSLDWTAMIGTGGKTKPASPSVGALPSAPDDPMSSSNWTSTIGTGSAADWDSGLK